MLNVNFNSYVNESRQAVTAATAATATAAAAAAVVAPAAAAITWKSSLDE